MTGREVIQALHEGRRVYASAMVSNSPLWPSLVKQRDSISCSSIPNTCRSTADFVVDLPNLSSAGLPPVVRIPCNDPFEACKALDAGAGGVIGPYLETADQVRGLVGAVKLRPLKGRCLQEALHDPNTLEPELRDYLEQRNGDKILIANIESVPAIENLHEICSVPGLDAVLIGPHDLSCSLGIPEQYDHPRFDEAARTIFRIAREHHVGAGMHFWLGIDRQVAWAKAGGNLVMHSSDLFAFSHTIKSEVAHLRKSLDG